MPWNSSGYRASQYAGGDGTESNPYQIATAAQLGLMSYNMNTTTNYSKGKYFELTSDISLSGNTIASMGSRSSSYAFQGTFNGNNHTISNINIYVNNYDTDDALGFFGYATNCIIKNIRFDKMVIKNSENSECLARYIGFLIGHCGLSKRNNNIISNICIKNSNIASHYKVQYMGTIVGCCVNTISITSGNHLDLDNIDIINSYADVYDDATLDGYWVGGLIGTGSNGLYYHINNCNINFDYYDNSKKSTKYYGGITGKASIGTYPSIYDLTNVTIKTKVTENSNMTGKLHVGGLAGVLGGKTSASVFNINNVTVSINRISFASSASTGYNGSLIGGNSYTCNITVTDNSLYFNNDNSNITNYNNGIQTTLPSYNYSFSANKGSGYYNANKSMAKLYTSIAHDCGTNWSVLNSLPVVLTTYMKSAYPSLKNVKSMQLVDNDNLFSFESTDVTTKTIYTTESTYTIPTPDSYTYLGITAKVTDTAGTVLYSSVSSGSTISVPKDLIITIDSVNTTKIISYKKDSSTIVDVSDIVYKSGTSTVRSMADYKYKKNSSTVV